MHIIKNHSQNKLLSNGTVAYEKAIKKSKEEIIIKFSNLKFVGQKEVTLFLNLGSR